MDGCWTYVIGDIHGCLDALLALEAKAARHAARNGARPFVVAVGDLVDRGPDSAGVVRRFREGAAAGTHAAVAGNHEQELLRVLYALAPRLFEATGPPRRVGPSLAELHAAGAGDRHGRRLAWPDYRRHVQLNWLAQGGAETLASWGADPQEPRGWRPPAEDLAFLADLPVLWESPAAVVTHARASAGDLARLRAGQALPAAWSTAAWAEAVGHALWNRQAPPGPPDAARWHVSGHTPRPRVRRQRRLRSLVIDTGLVYGGRLTAWCAETDGYLSVRRG